MSAAASEPSALNAATLAALGKLRFATFPSPNASSIGEERSRRRGRSNELIDFRQYIAGDDLRDIDWNAVARHDELYTRIYAQEISQPVEFYVDASPSMRWGKDGEKFRVAKELALGLTTVASASGCSAKIILGHHAPIPHLRGHSIAEAQAQVEALEFDDISLEVPPIDVVLVERAKRKAHAMVVVISDGYEFEAIQPALRALHARGVPIGFLQVLSPFELSPQLDADFTLKDGLGEVRVSGNEDTLARYDARLNEFLGMWRKAIKRVKGNYALIRSDASLASLAAKELPQSGLVIRR
ncbi:MAG: DUF58 domain-containing protein [Planctomycetes bacterium]|nr:DUF58 domain-containing protein [Planctomycetota bacterium]